MTPPTEGDDQEPKVLYSVRCSVTGVATAGSEKYPTEIPQCQFGGVHSVEEVDV